MTATSTPTVTVTSVPVVGFGGLLTITFVVLKALGYIDWSWLWVFSPLWIPWAIFFALAIVFLIGAVIWAVFFDKPKYPRYTVRKR